MTNLYSIFRQFPRISTDTRNIEPGSIFFALRGVNFDGNRYAAEALRKGAAYAVADDPRFADGERIILVNDSLRALQELAAVHRRELGIPILAITGTNGKTTTKELAARVLSRKFRISVTQGNLNNHIGVPLTLLKMDSDTQFGIVEMGASARGEIKLLCEIAAPDYGIVTNVGRAHLEGFGGEHGVRAGKGELYDWLSANAGTAFIRGDDHTLRSMAEERPGLSAVFYDISSTAGMLNPLAGEFNRMNMAAALAVGEYFGIGRRDIQEALESYTPENHRSQLIETGRNRVIADCYNANPSSMRTALESFAEEVSDLRKAVILGDMLELGEESPGEHSRIIEFLGELDFGEIYLVGELFEKAARGAKTFPDVEEFKKHLSSNPVSDRFILLKGSNGIKLDSVLPLL